MPRLHIQNFAQPAFEDALELLIPVWEPHFQVITQGWGASEDHDDATHSLAIVDCVSAYQSLSTLPDREWNQLTYIWLAVPTPFISPHTLKAAALPDFCVAMGGMSAQVLREGVAANGAAQDKELFKLAHAIRPIRPGVDHEKWRPLIGYRREYGREEIRQALMPGTDDQAFVVLTAMDDGADLATAFAICARLQGLLEREVHVYGLRCCDGTPARLAEGAGVERFHGLPEIPDDERLNLMFNAADLFLCTSVVSKYGWPFLLSQAMAAGCVCAAPNEHVWLELCDEGRGLELPTGIFEESSDLLYRGDQHYIRRVMPGDGARVIADAWQTGQFKEVRERAIAWAQLNRLSTWERCAEDWLHLFGIR